MESSLGQQRIDLPGRGCGCGYCGSLRLGRISLVQGVKARPGLKAIQPGDGACWSWGVATIAGRLLVAALLLFDVVVVTAAVRGGVLGRWCRLFWCLGGDCSTAAKFAAWQQTVAAGAMQIEAGGTHWFRVSWSWCSGLTLL